VRTAGSTFRNPLPDDLAAPPVLRDRLPEGQLAAGKLIDRSDCKGYRLGGAHISDKHANFIVAQPGATASDVMSLAAWMRRRVFDTFGVTLQMEIERLGDWSEWQPSGDEPVRIAEG
jgi:UDP-N-acetylenolpyruvoylglucosamine reductase